MNGKIIKITSKEISIGLENGDIAKVKASQVEFENPEIGTEVEVFGTGKDAVVNLVSVSNKALDLNVPYPNQVGDPLLLTAFILNIVFMAGLGLLIIPLAWMIPMTIASYKAYKGTRPNTIALGVTTLIFFDWIGGILQLVAPHNEKKY